MQFGIDVFFSYFSSPPNYTEKQAAAIDQILKAKSDYEVLGVAQGAGRYGNIP